MKNKFDMVFEAVAKGLSTATVHIIGVLFSHIFISLEAKPNIFNIFYYVKGVVIFLCSSIRGIVRMDE